MQSSTTGTGNLTVAAVNGKQAFGTAFGTGVSTNVFDYFISNQAAAEWERGTGHMSDATTLVRDTVIESTNANAAVSFSAGTKDVVNDVPAANQVRSDQLGSGIATFLATPSSANLRAAITDETGTGAAYFQGGDIGTPSAGNLANCTGYPGGSWSLLATLTTTSGATQSATGLGTNSMYLILISGVSGAGGANRTLSIAMSTNNGSTYDTAINLATMASIADTCTGFQIIPAAQSNVAKRVISVIALSPTPTAPVTTLGTSSGATAAVNALQFSMTGSFDLGAIYVYGM